MTKIPEEKHPEVLKHEAIRDIVLGTQRLFYPMARKMVITLSDDYIQIMVFPNRGQLDWVGEETIVHEVEDLGRIGSFYTITP